MENKRRRNNRLYEQPIGTWITRDDSSTYFGFVKNILDKLSGSGAATGLFSSVLSGVVYYFDTLANVIPTLSLAGLYYSYQMRKAERLGIYYGLKPRP